MRFFMKVALLLLVVSPMIMGTKVQKTKANEKMILDKATFHGKRPGSPTAKKLMNLRQELIHIVEAQEESKKQIMKAVRKLDKLIEEPDPTLQLVEDENKSGIFDVMIDYLGMVRMVLNTTLKDAIGLLPFPVGSKDPVISTENEENQMIRDDVTEAKASTGKEPSLMEGKDDSQPGVIVGTIQTIGTFFRQGFQDVYEGAFSLWSSKESEISSEIKSKKGHNIMDDEVTIEIAQP